MSGYEGCPMCGDNEVSEEHAEMIEGDMEYDHRSCIHCGRTFEEVREDLEAEEW